MSDTVTIQVFAISAEGEHHDISLIDVNINDKLQNLVDLLAIDNLSGSFMYKSQILKEEKLDQTFAKLFVKSGDKIGLMQGEGTLKEPMRYIRFAAYEEDCGDGVYNFREDAIAFVPK